MVSVEDMAKLVSKDCDAELAYIFAEEEVPLQVQYDFVSGAKMKPIKTVRRFAGLEDTCEKVRKVCTDELNMTDRVDIAAVVGAWEVAVLSKTKEDEAKTTSRVTNMPHLSRPFKNQDGA